MVEHITLMGEKKNPHNILIRDHGRWESQRERDH
jgi:hypothetical protein